MKSLFRYAAETRGFIVRVSVSFLPEQSEVVDRLAAPPREEQLLGLGAHHLVDGEGVVGEQPVIKPGGAYDYVSGCPLTTPSGSMQGSYQMLGEDGSRFDIAIPKFALTTPVTAG